MTAEDRAGPLPRLRRPPQAAGGGEDGGGEDGGGEDGGGEDGGGEDGGGAEAAGEDPQVSEPESVKVSPATGRKRQS
jgi:hypothetical protein